MLPWNDYLRFHTLPTEVLFSVARFLGSRYLQARVEILLLFQAWYAVAHDIFMEHLSLTNETLTRFVVAPNIHSRLHSVRELSIEYDSGKYRNETRDAARGAARDIELSRYRNYCEQLLSCAYLLPKMFILKAFCLRIATSINRNEVCLWPTPNILTSLPKSLISLTIDIPDQWGTSTDRPKTHELCHFLLNADTLPRLRHLHLRTLRICPKIFETVDLEGRHQLQTLVVNVARYVPGHIYFDKATRLCVGDGDPGSEKGILVDMIEAAKIAAARAPETTIRVIRLEFPSFELISLNALLNRKPLNTDSVSWEDWDDDGLTILEFDSQEQTDVDLFEDSSLNSDPFITLSN